MLTGSANVLIRWIIQDLKFSASSTSANDVQAPQARLGWIILPDSSAQTYLGVSCRWIWSLVDTKLVHKCLFEKATKVATLFS